jgi:TrmH family RNA methyltransferase
MVTSPFRIESLQNKRIKEAVKLGKRNERDRQQRTLVEGRRETERALLAGIRPVEVFICSDILGAEADALVETLNAAGVSTNTLFDTTPAVYAKLAYRSDTGGIIMIVPYFARALRDLTLSPNPLLLVVEGVEKPGNLGAILRTADGAGVDAVIVTNGATDLHNPNTIRAALGACFTVPVAEARNDQTLAYLRSHQIQTVATSPGASRLYWDADYKPATALLLGSEAEGLSPSWLAQADTSVRLPMQGTVDSLNLSTATAIVLYEALRQRVQPN